MIKYTQEQILEAKKESLRKLAKRANQRFVRLERNTDVNLDELQAYQNAQTFLSTQKVKGVRISDERFVESKSTINKLTESQIDAQILHAKAFLDSKLSTVKGIKEMYKKTANSLTKTISKKLGEEKKITPKQARNINDYFGELMKKGAYKKKWNKSTKSYTTEGGLSSDEVITSYYDILDKGEENPVDFLGSITTYEQAKDINYLFNYEVFNLNEFEKELKDDEGYEENK